MRKFLWAFVMGLVIASTIFYSREITSFVARMNKPPVDVEELKEKAQLSMSERLAARGMAMGDPAFIRIFKEEAVLEVWLATDGQFELFQSYPICNYSGHLGPKLKEGDRQSPEGFYTVPASAMNPNSSYHLSFNLGFPNAYDRSHGRTGSYLMVHGDCLSIGCYAMTDEGIEEIYALVDAAQRMGQASVPVHAFPFRMTDERLGRELQNRWYGYWANLKQGYDLFEETRVPPKTRVENQTYVFEMASL